MDFEMVDNTNAVQYGGFELVDTTTTPPCTFAIAMPREYAQRTVKALNNFDQMREALQIALDFLNENPEAGTQQYTLEVVASALNNALFD